MFTPRVYAAYPVLVNGAYSALHGPAYASSARHEPDEKKALGKRLADAREVSALSQSEAAKQLGIGKAALSAWEVGRNLPDALMLGRAARVYRVSADALLWGVLRALDDELQDLVHGRVELSTTI